MDFGQKKLNDRHLVAQDHSRAWTFVTVKDRFRPARWKYSDDTHLYSIHLVALNIRDAMSGGSGHTDVIRMRDDSVEGLRKKLEQAFGAACVFSDASPEMSLKEEHALEVKAAKEAKAKQDAAEAEQARVVAAHKEIADSMSDAEVAEYRSLELSAFINSPTWNKWFRENAQDGVGFLSFPNNEGRNRAAVLRFCEQRGFRVPNFQVLDEAMRYLLNNKHFYMKNTYKRSETDAFHAVVQFDAIQSDARRVYYSDQQIQDATKKLQRVLPVGQAVSLEFAHRKAMEIGISEALFRDIAAGQAQSSAVLDVAGKSAKELKRDLAAMRPRVDPDLRRRGY